MFAEGVLFLLSTVGNLLIGLFTLLKNPRRATNVLFFALTVVIAMWATATYISNLSPENLLVWVRVVIFFGAVLAELIFLTLYVFPNEKIVMPGWILWGSWIFTAAVALLNLTSAVFQRLTINSQPVPGPALPLFLIQILVLVGGGIVSLIIKRRRSVGKERTQLSFVLSGILLTFALIVATNLILVVFFGDISFISLGPAFTLIFVGMTSYAIVKHQLLDIRLVIARVLAYGVVIGVVAAGYALALLALLKLFGVEWQGVAGVALAIVAMLSFDPLKDFIRRTVDRYVFSGEYDPEELAARVVREGSSTIVLGELTNTLLKTLVDGLRVRYCTLIVFKDAKMYHRAQAVHAGAKRPAVPPPATLATLVRKGSPLFFDELPEGKDRNFLRKEQIAAAMPLHVEHELVALFLLGEKMNGTGYTLRDVHFLERVSPAIGTAVQNAKAYEEISRFADTLKKKVAEATAELRAANVQLESLNEMKSNFVSIASHQLRAPIGGIRSYLAMFKDGDLGPVTEKQKEIIQMNMEELRHMLAVIQMFLDVTKMEAGKIELERKPTDLKAMASEVAAELAENAKRKGLDLKLALAAVPKMPLDAERMHNIVLNLIENAVKYTEKGSVEVSLRRTNGKVEFRVKDSGIGIAKEEIPKLFAKFVRAGGGFKVSHGSGLGLYIVKTLVEAHGGEAFVESPGVGKGSTFGFRLPIK